MNPSAVILHSVSHRLFQFGFVALALFIPFSIAGANFGIGFSLLAWLLGTIAFRMAQPCEITTYRPQKTVRSDPLFWGAVLLMVSAAPTLLISEDFQRAFKDWRSYWLLSICFVVAANLAVNRLREIVFWVLFSSITISCIVALIQRAGGVDAGFIHIGAQKRVSSTLFTMTFAGILYQTILLTLAVVLRRGAEWRVKIILWAGVALQLVAILFTVTRGAWVALFAGLVAVCLLVRNKTVLIFGSFVVVLVLSFALITVQNTGRNVSPILLFRHLDVHASTRLVLWDIAWDLFKKNPVLGVGMGDYETEANALVGNRTVTTTTDSHNVYLQVLATRGLVGFVPFILFWWLIFRSLFRVRNRAEKGSIDWHYAVGAIGATVAVLFGALTENNVDDEEVFIAYMFITGLALSAEYVAGKITRAASRERLGEPGVSLQNGDTGE